MPDAPSIDLRPAAPTLEDGRRYARYSDQASHGLVRRMFGRTYVDILAKAFLSEGHYMSYETTRFALIDGTVVGMTSAYSSEYQARSSNRPMISAAGIRLLRVATVVVPGWRLFRFIAQIPDGDYYVAAVAVDADRQGAGIGTRLLDDVEAQASSAGCRRLALDVDIDNPDARRLYERRGMSVEAESPSMWLQPQSRVLRMTKEL